MAGKFLHFAIVSWKHWLTPYMLQSTSVLPSKQRWMTSSTASQAPYVIMSKKLDHDSTDLFKMVPKENFLSINKICCCHFFIFKRGSTSNCCLNSRKLYISIPKLISRKNLSDGKILKCEDYALHKMKMTVFHSLKSAKIDFTENQSCRKIAKFSNC